MTPKNELGLVSETENSVIDCSRVKIGGGGGLDPHWKAANPHCKHRIKS